LVLSATTKRSPSVSYEEERLVLLDRPPNEACPLVGIVEWPGRAILVVEESCLR